MKVLCEKCKNDLSKQVEHNLENFIAGSIECPHCKRKQKRYLSETDLLVYFFGSVLFYLLLIIIISLLFDYIGVNLTSILVIVIGFVIAYFVLKNFTHYIYEIAPVKFDFKDYQFEEDKDAVSKRMKWQFMAFILVSLLMGYDPSLFHYFAFLIVAFVAVVGIKIYLSYKKERDIVYEELLSKEE